jgi:S-(hydroxymethyl)glutathione dehydrogenase / alcohol dehydrogenase
MAINKTKAAILQESHKPLLIEEILFPTELDVGQVLVQILFTSICGSQLNEIDAVKGPDKYLPHLLGHEASAIVLEIGPGVKHVKVDDYVVLHWRPGLGIQAEPYKYIRKDGSAVNAGWVTTFQEYAVVSENRMTVIPTNFDPKIAPLLGCAVTTAYGVITNEAKVKIGESVLVIGVGGVGANVVQFAKLAGAYPIVAVDKEYQKLNSVANYADTMYSSLEVRTVETYKAYNNAKSFDKVIETTGNKQMIELAYAITAPQGTCVLVGVPKEKVEIYTLPLHFKKILTGSHGGESQPHIDIPRIVKLITNKRYNLTDAISNTYPLPDINQAIDLMRNGKALGRIVIQP